MTQHEPILRLPTALPCSDCIYLAHTILCIIFGSLAEDPAELTEEASVCQYLGPSLVCSHLGFYPSPRTQPHFMCLPLQEHRSRRAGCLLVATLQIRRGRRTQLGSHCEYRPGGCGHWSVLRHWIWSCENPHSASVPHLREVSLSKLPMDALLLCYATRSCAQRASCIPASACEGVSHVARWWCKQDQSLNCLTISCVLFMFGIPQGQF